MLLTMLFPPHVRLAAESLAAEARAAGLPTNTFDPAVRAIFAQIQPHAERATDPADLVEARILQRDDHASRFVWLLGTEADLPRQTAQWRETIQAVAQRVA